MRHHYLALRAVLAGYCFLTLLGAAVPASAASCTPRPAVGMQVAPLGPQQTDLVVTLTAGTSAGLAQNALDAVRFNTIQGARIDAGSLTDQTHTFELTLPAGTEQFRFVVHPTQAGVTPTVHLVVHDACGAWPTFVGGQYTPPSVSCSPRPPVRITTQPQDAETTQTTIWATGVYNTLQALEIGATANAQLDLQDQTGVTDPYTAVLPAGTWQFSFTIHHGTGAYRVPLIAIDGCGRWPTLVGSGGGSFPPGGSGGGSGGEAAVSCVPRPPVALVMTEAGDGVQSSLHATGTANRLLALTFGAAENGFVEVPNHPTAPGNFTLTVPQDTPTVSFTLRRLGATPAMVPLTVVDRCGAWATQVSTIGLPPSLRGGDDFGPTGGPVDLPGAPTPELGSLVLFSVGALALAGVAWRQRRRWNRVAPHLPPGAHPQG